MRILVMLALAACAGSRGSARDDTATFRVFYPDAPFKATTGKRFAVKPVGQCVYTNGRDARWSMTGARIESGELAPGLAIEDGAISGIPKQAGTWTVRVKFSGVICAGQATEPQLVDVTIAVAAKR